MEDISSISENAKDFYKSFAKELKEEDFSEKHDDETLEKNLPKKDIVEYGEKKSGEKDDQSQGNYFDDDFWKDKYNINSELHIAIEALRDNQSYKIMMEREPEYKELSPLRKPHSISQSIIFDEDNNNNNNNNKNNLSNNNDSTSPFTELENFLKYGAQRKCSDCNDDSCPTHRDSTSFNAERNILDDDLFNCNNEDANNNKSVKSANGTYTLFNDKEMVDDGGDYLNEQIATEERKLQDVHAKVQDIGKRISQLKIILNRVDDDDDQPTEELPTFDEKHDPTDVKDKLKDIYPNKEAQLDARIRALEQRLSIMEVVQSDILDRVFPEKTTVAQPGKPPVIELSHFQQGYELSWHLVDKPPVDVHYYEVWYGLEVIEGSPNYGIIWNKNTETVPPCASCKLRDLVPGRYHHVTVRAIHVDGTPGAFSEPITFFNELGNVNSCVIS